LHRKALALDEQGHGDEAIALLKRALEADPQDPELHYDLAKVHENNNQAREAVAAYRKYLAFNPPSALARQVQDAIDNLERNEK
jgi:Flp pilus assembly protein TadD